VGRPSKGERVAITARLTDAQCDKLDAFAEVAGIKTRSEAIGGLVDAYDPFASRVPHPPAPPAQFITKGVRIPGVKPVEGTPSEHTIQVGPIKAAPGSRLKGAKRK
jgi:hypothetical protein